MFGRYKRVVFVLISLLCTYADVQAQQAKPSLQTKRAPTRSRTVTKKKPRTVTKASTKPAVTQTLPDTGLAKPKEQLAVTGKADTTKRADTVKVSNDLTTTVVYTADDSIVFAVKTRIARLYGAADITYGDINLKAAEVQVDYTTNLVDAKGSRDSTGKQKGAPVFTQGNEKFQSERMQYNFKTRKGIIRQVITQQGEGYIHGESVKRESEEALYIKNAEYTTCNLEHPHFYIKSYKMKMIPGKKIISGPFSLNIADVPTPLGFLFGFFPIPKYKSSGIIIPTYGESRTQGFFLRNGGFYFALSDYFDLKLLGEIYTLGGWGLTPTSQYKKRYRYDGNVSVRYNIRPVAFADGTRKQGGERDLWVNWSHTPFARGNSRFSANVNAGTSQANARFSNNLNTFFSSTFSSNINYSTSFTGTPFSLSLAARADQNTLSKVFNVDLPTVALTMNRIFPFKKTGSTANNALSNLTFSYSLTSQHNITNARTASSILPTDIRNLSATEEGASASTTPIPLQSGTISTLLKNARFGIQHVVPISTTFRMFKYFNVSPSLQYNEVWYLKRLRYSYDAAQNGVSIDTVTGFNRFYSYSAGASMSTQVYGTVFVRKGKVEAIRHRMTPTIGGSYRPDFGTSSFGFFQNTQVASTERRNLNPYAGFLYGGPSAGGRVGAINFSLTNVLEAKLRNVSDSGKVTYKKLNLLENLSLGGNYNLLADSFRLSPINVSLNTRLFDKINIASGFIVDPYAYENRPVSGAAESRNLKRSQQYALATGQGLGKITSANLSLGFSLKPPGGTKPKELPRKNLSEAEEQELTFIRNNPQLFVDFTIPWTLNLQYNATYGLLTRGTKTGDFRQNVRIGGDVSISPKWKLGFDSPFDFQTRQFSSTSLNIYRDLHCWEMRMNVIVAGTRPSYQFDINVKASILQDLKLSKRNSFYDR